MYNTVSLGYICIYIYTQVISNLPKLLTAGMSYTACGLYLQKSILQQLSITTIGRRNTAGGKWCRGSYSALEQSKTVGIPYCRLTGLSTGKMTPSLAYLSWPAASSVRSRRERAVGLWTARTRSSFARCLVPAYLTHQTQHQKTLGTSHHSCG